MELNLKEKPIIGSCSRKRNKGKELLFIPDDILVDILCRLPDKALVRFKSVSKAWFLLISYICAAIRPRPVVGLFIRTSIRLNTEWERDSAYTDFFSYFFSQKIKRHSNNYASLPEEGGKLFEWDETLISSYGLPFKPDHDEFLDCCNGLLLFVDSKSSQYYVSNPATGQSVLIPRPHWEQTRRYMSVGLAFNPSRSSVYKIVRFQMLTTKPTQVVEIYSSDSGAWSEHKLLVPTCLYGRCPGWFRPAAYFDGSLIRLSYSWHLVQYDIREEVSVSVIELPLSLNKCRGLVGQVGVLMGRLCYANVYRDTVHIWSLDGGRWVLSQRFSLQGLTEGMRAFRKGGPKWVEPVAFHPTSNVVFLGTPVLVLAYDLDHNRLKEIIRIENEDENVMIFPGSFFPAFTYVRFLTRFGKHGNISPIPVAY